MLISGILNRITIGLLILTAIIVIDTSNFAGAGLAADGKFGFSSKVISGYAASDVIYNFDNNGRATLNNLILNLVITDDTSVPTELRVKLVSNSDTWFDCTANTGRQWVCDTTDTMVQAVEIDQLSVVGARSAWN